MNGCNKPLGWVLVCVYRIIGAIIAFSSATAANAEDGYPYNPLIYHMDLSALSYKLNRQSMIWPFDPYYEEMDIGGDHRDETMTKIRAWASATGRNQTRASSGTADFRGPGILSGFDNNLAHDPIIYRYDQIHPWSNSITNMYGAWTEDRTPTEITSKISNLYVCSRPPGSARNESVTTRLKRQNDRRIPLTGDSLLAFEGGTGDKGELNQPASQSLMGFVLLRNKAGGAYDVHIVFRGSESGSVSRAVVEAISGSKASGNPDWITDLGYDRIGAKQGGAEITLTGKVHRGFVRSVSSILPSLFQCLKTVADIKRGNKPETIYITGHSLGAGLAQHFASAVHLGNKYGPKGKGKLMPKKLREWPWKQFKLITFSAPRTGDKTFAKLMTESVFDSVFFSSLINPFDRKALKVTDKSIVQRLLDQNRPAAYRVLHSRDPVSSEKGAGGKHIGKTVYVNKWKLSDAFAPPDDQSHRLDLMRRMAAKSLQDDRVPPTVAQYHDADKMAPNRDPAQQGSASDLKQLAEVVRTYFRKNKIWFDQQSFDENLALRLEIEGVR